MKVLIIGANSILSKAIIRQHSHDEVNVLYHTRPSELVSVNYPVSQLKEIRRDYDRVYILSAVISNNINDSESLFEVNIKLVQEICERFVDSKIIYFSSVAVYDGISGGTINEKTKPCPESVYGISKLWAEKIIAQHPKYSILRISSMFGEEMKNTTFLPKIIDDALNKKEITILGNGGRTQNYIDAQDVALLAKKLGDLPENRTQLAIGEKNYSNLETAQIIKEFTGCEITFSGEDFSRSLEYSQDTFPYSEYNFTSFEEGLKQLIEWKRRQS